jgi:Transposase IS66 family/zinc-finger binding domain of transposase IS66
VPNSSQPSSKNPLTFKPNRKQPTGKKRGGQIGHIRHERKLYPVDACQEVIDHYPKQCIKCGAEVSQSVSTKVYRHQVVEVPPVQPIVIEHRFHPMTCTCCGTENQAPEMAEIIGKSGQEKLLFNLWHRFRNEQLTSSELRQAVEPIQAKFSSILMEAAELQIGEHEKTPLTKTVRTCRNLLKLSDSLWLFVREDGVEPTNNAAERAIRPAVIWRRTSFGSDSAAGSEFVSRLLTVVSSLNLQERNILNFLVESVSAVRSGEIPPSLLP